jgi:hypothetical protein
MTEVFVYTVVAVVAAVLGATAGRVFAVEAENRLAAIFAGAYVGAGVGLMSAMPMGSLLTLVAQSLNAGSSTWLEALDVRAWRYCGGWRAAPQAALRSASSSRRLIYERAGNHKCFDRWSPFYPPAGADHSEKPRPLRVGH